MDSKQRDTDELMGLNHLKYEVPANLALAQEGSIFKKNNADIQQYSSQSGTELIVTLQSSTDFVYGPNCYLRFDVKADGLVTGGDDCGLGFLNSPATALFSRFLLEDKSGAEIERVEDLNKAVRSILPWKYPQDYLGTATAAGQFSAPAVAPVDATGAAAADLAVNDPAAVGTGRFLRVCIPLWYFSGMFKEQTLIPPSLISGARFRLTLAKAQVALSIISSTSGGVPAGFDATALSYTISDPVIMLDSYSMATSVQRNIMEQMGSVDGVPFTYCSLYNQTAQPATSTDFTLQINKAVARAEKIYVATQNTDVGENAAVDCLGTQELGVFQYQARVGDWYAPQQTLQCGVDDTVDGVRRNCSELYTNALQCTHGLSDPYHSSVTLTQFRGNARPAGVPAGAANGGYGVLVQTLNQSPHIGDAGIAINNSRTAEVRIRYASDNDDPKSITSWLEYIKLACVYPMRTIVKQ